MEFLKSNKNTILAVIGVLLTICGVIMTVAAVVENKRVKQIAVTEVIPSIEE